MSLNCDHQLAYCSFPRLYMSIESCDGIILTRENRRTRRRTCPSATLFITISTLTNPGANSGLHDERSATNRVSLTRPRLTYSNDVASGVNVRVFIRNINYAE
jgi:hypothetical protein